MKNRRKQTVFVLLIVLLIFWQDKLELLRDIGPADNQAEGTNKVNSSLGLSNEKEKERPLDVPLNMSAKNAEHVEEGIRSYLVVYRDLQMAKDCEYIYRDHHMNKWDKAQIYDHRFFRQAESLENKAVVEKVFFQMYDQCMGLESEVLARNKRNSGNFDYASPASKLLIQELMKAPVMNLNEEQFKLVHEQSKNLTRAYGIWFRVAMGSPLHSKDELQGFQIQTKELQNAMDQLGYGPATANQWQSLFEQQQALHQKAAKTLPPDTEKLNEVIHYHQELISYLTPTLASRHVEAFKLVFNAMNNARSFKVKVSQSDWFEAEQLSLTKELTTINQVLFEATPFKSTPAYFDVVGEVAGYLYLCDLGQDCSATSTITRDYCLGLNGLPKTVSACGQDVRTFYQTHYISPNIWPDVQTMLVTMKEVLNG